MEDPLPSSSTHHIPAQNNFTEKSNSLVLPKQLENIKASTEFPQFRHRWNTNEEIASVLISFSRHKEWMHLEMKVRPPSGSMILYSRNKVRYRKDGYCWKKRKDGKNIREDHMKLKVQGLECIYGSYVHSDILPTFHRRCYWLLQNPDIVLVHYLNVPYPDNTKVKIPVMPPCTVEKKEWTKEELVDQLRPMFSTGQPGEESEQMIDERVEALVKHLIEYHENRDKFTKQKCEKFCDKRCSHSSIVKIPHHGHSSVVIDTSQFTHSQCSAKLPCKAAQTRTTSSLQQTKRNVPEQGSCNSGSTGGGMIVHHKEDELSCSTDLAQVPYILNLAAHIHVPTSSYLIVNGQTNPISTSAALETNCQPHCQSSTPNIVLAHQTQGLNFSAVKLEHNSATTLQPSELQHEVLQQQQKLLMQNSHLQKPVTNCADLSPVEQLVSDSKQVCVPMQLSCDENLTNLDDNAKCDKINLVPYLKTVTADDVQEVVQSHPSSSTKDKSKGDLNVLENDSLSASLGSSDFDHLDLDLPDLDKLYSFLGSGSDVQTSSEEVILHDAGQIQSVNCVQSRPELCDNEKCSGQLQHCQGQLHFQGEGHLQGQCCLQPLTYGNQESKSVMVNSGKGVVCNRSSQTSEDSLGAVRNGNPASDHGNQTLMDIVDFSPEWSYVEGGSKLLVIGPWYRTSSKYTCVIDDIPVQTTYVQPGVLRCYTPAHTSGYVSLQVSCDGVVISDSKTFEYKKRAEDCGSKIDWFSCDEYELKLLLIDKLIELEGRLMESQYRDGPVPSIKQAGQDLAYSDDLQGKLSWYVKMFSAGTWKDVDTFLIANRYNMTLLHLSAALGYARLIHALIQWRNDNPCMILDYEVDGSCQDNQSYTPMMWACAKGNLQAAVTLYHWNSDTLNIPNKDGVIPLDLAQSNGHFALHEELVKLQQSNSNSYIFSGEPFVAAGSVTAPNSFPDTPSKVLNLPFCTSTPHSDQDKNLFKSPHPLSSSKDNGCLGMLHIDIPSSSVFSNSGGRKSLVRRQSDQTLPVNAARRKLSKRFSVDLPSDTDNARSSRAGSCDRPIREANSEPHLSMVSVHPMTRGDNPMLSDHGRDITSPDILMHTDSVDPGKMTLDHLVDMNLNLSSTMTSNAGLIKMETDDLLSSASGSPLIDVENVSSDDDNVDQYGGHSRSDRQSISTDNSDEAKQQMVTLAKQIIAAMPERIKSSPSRGDDLVVEQTRERSGSYSSVPSQPSPHASSYEEDSGISTRMVDGLAFDEYRYPDISTPASSLSPDSTCLPSPYSPYSFTLDSPPPTTEDFTEYFNAPATFMEKDFSQLTLSDQEQRKLYEAAKVIQKTYRLYRDKQQLQQQQQKEIEAAVLIQKYYRRYKQYAYYKKMTQAAVLIQSQFRSYYAQKRFKKSRDAAVVIQNQYRTYKEHERRKKGGNKSVIIQQRYRSHYQRKNMKGQSADGHIVQIVPESTDSSPPDQSSTCTDPTKHQDDERAPSSAAEEQQGE